MSSPCETSSALRTFGYATSLLHFRTYPMYSLASFTTQTPEITLFMPATRRELLQVFAKCPPLYFVIRRPSSALESVHAAYLYPTRNEHRRSRLPPIEDISRIKTANRSPVYSIFEFMLPSAHSGISPKHQHRPRGDFQYHLPGTENALHRHRT